MKAFPQDEWVIPPGGAPYEKRKGGMDLRDYFAAAAMTGVARARSDADNIAVTAYEIADAMMKVRDE